MMQVVAKLTIAGLALVSVLSAEIQVQQDPQQGAEKKPKKLKKARAMRAVRLAPMQRRKPPTQAELVDFKTQKLKGEWLAKAPWILDFDAAKAESKKTGKPIFAYFTRSYAP